MNKLHRSLALLFLSCILLPSALSAQSLSHLQTVKFPSIQAGPFDTGNSDCWGWTSPDGTDYIIMGTLYGLHFVRASDGMVLDSVEGPRDRDFWYHRDMVTYKHYCLAVAEMYGTNQGMQVIDLSYLPDSVHLLTVHQPPIQGDTNCHNMDVDTATGMAYLMSGNGAYVRIIDMNDPANPVEISSVPIGELHDIHARNDTLRVAEGNRKSFSVWDVSDKQNPVMITRVNNPGFGYCHNIWPSDDGKFFITTEETDSKTIKIWDMSDPLNVNPRGEILAACNLAHNVQVMGRYIFVSHYESGLVVIDWSDPDNPVIVADYDTYPASDSAKFRGCWGAFPYTENGYVYVSSFDGRLDILQWEPAVLGLPQAGTSGNYLGTPYPNPSEGELTIPLNLPVALEGEISIVDVLGKTVTELKAGLLSPGQQELRWNSEGLQAGVYFVRFSSGESSEVRKVIVGKR